MTAQKAKLQSWEVNVSRLFIEMHSSARHRPIINLTLYKQTNDENTILYKLLKI